MSHFQFSMEICTDVIAHFCQAGSFPYTASNSTKRKIFEMLSINRLTTQITEKDPNKNNIRYAVKMICHCKIHYCFVELGRIAV